MLIKKIIKTILPLILGGFLVWYSISKISINTLLQYFINANYFWIILGIFFGLLSHISRAYRWKFLLQPMGYKPKLTNSIMAVFVAYLVNLTIPRAGEVSRAGVMTNYEDIPFEKGFGTIVAERIADLLMLLTIVIITLFVQFNFIYDLLVNKINPTKIIVGLLILLLGFIFFSRLIKKSTSGFLFKIKTFVNGLLEGILSILKMENKWSFIFHTIFIWVMYVVMFWSTIFAIKDFNVPFGAVLVGFIAGGFSMATTNGGIGMYPIAVSGAFALFGVNEEQATAFGWIVWTSQTLIIIVFGGLSFLLLPICNKGKK
ncbi:MAG: flippase-like domain-containing protein [Tenacibaculum sp.]|nr:flippase-like domain-containing protein [Tenacibaculum sp.]